MVPAPPTVPACPRCSGELDLFQPSPGLPDRVVGVCLACGALFGARPAHEGRGWAIEPAGPMAG